MCSVLRVSCHSRDVAKLQDGNGKQWAEESGWCMDVRQQMWTVGEGKRRDISNMTEAAAALLFGLTTNSNMLGAGGFHSFASMPIAGSFWGWRGAGCGERAVACVRCALLLLLPRHLPPAFPARIEALHCPRLILVPQAGSGTSRHRSIGKDAGHDTSHVRSNMHALDGEGGRWKSTDTSQIQ